MGTALIIVLAAVVLVVVFLIARRASENKRREMASGLRMDSTRAEERAKRAEIQAEQDRQTAESRAARADRIDPDTEAPRRRFFGRRHDEEAERVEEEASARRSR